MFRNYLITTHLQTCAELMLCCPTKVQRPTHAKWCSITTWLLAHVACCQAAGSQWWPKNASPCRHSEYHCKATPAFHGFYNLQYDKNYVKNTNTIRFKVPNCKQKSVEFLFSSLYLAMCIKTFRFSQCNTFLYLSSH